MAGFPLEQGTCRVVCRPNRSRPRRVTVKAVVRFANAAVRDGANECDVVDAVVTELGCHPCESLADDVAEALDVVQEVRNRLRNAVLAVLLSFGIIPGETMPKETFLQLLRRLLKSVKNIAGVAAALVELVLVATEAVDLLGGVAQTLAEVLECIEKQ